MLKKISLLFFVLILSSCSSISYNLSANKVLPRKGYVFIEKMVKLKKCEQGICQQGVITTVGSGFIVKTTYKGSFVITAAHVCTTDKHTLRAGVTASDFLKVQTLDGRYYDSKKIQYNRKIDACMLFVEDLVTGVEEVKLSSTKPKEGDKVYNIASPYGIHYKNVVPIFEGRYIGEREFAGLYTFEAGPGSSGSMILNEDGELIGLLHSVFRSMNSIVVGVSYDSLIQFINKGLIDNLPKYTEQERRFRMHGKL